MDPFKSILEAVGDFFSDVLRNVVGGMLQGVVEAIRVVGTWWMRLPPPEMESSGSVVGRGQAVVGEYLPLVGIPALAFALIVVARRRDSDSVVDLLVSMFRVVLVSGAGVATVSALLKFGNEAAPWFVWKISGSVFENGMIGVMKGGEGAALAGMSVGVLVLLVVVLVLSLLGSVLNMFFVMFSYGALPVMLVLLPITAAYAVTARGQAAFGKVVGWLAALVLFKPVAAVVYGVGIGAASLIAPADKAGQEDAGQVVLQALYGGVLLVAAAMTLPALVRLFAPAAAAGSRGMGAGGALVGAAMVATGAVAGVAGAGAARVASGAGGVASKAASGASGVAGGGRAGASGAPAGGKSGSPGSGGSKGSGPGSSGSVAGGDSSGVTGSSSSGSGSGSSPSGAGGSSDTSGGSSGSGAEAGKSGSGSSSSPSGAGGSEERSVSAGSGPSGAAEREAERAAVREAEGRVAGARGLRREGYRALGHQVREAEGSVERGDES